MDEASIEPLRFRVVAIVLKGHNLQAAQEEDAEIIPPVPASTAAQAGLELHEKFGGGKNLKVARAIAQRQSLTSGDIDVIVDFFDNYEWDDTDPGWLNHENPSPDWIRYLLMGSYPCMRWAKEVKDWLNGKGEKPKYQLPPQSRTVSQQDLINAQQVLEWRNPWSSSF
jgi:hypothetical protein